MTEITTVLAIFSLAKEEKEEDDRNQGEGETMSSLKRLKQIK